MTAQPLHAVDDRVTHRRFGAGVVTEVLKSEDEPGFDCRIAYDSGVVGLHPEGSIQKQSG